MPSPADDLTRRFGPPQTRIDPDMSVSRAALLNPDFAGLLFATSNPAKVREYSQILGYDVASSMMNLPEPDVSPTMWRKMARGEYKAIAEEIADRKAREGWAQNSHSPIVTESALFFVPSLDGFPGPFIGDLEGPQARSMLARQPLDPTIARGGSDLRAVAMVTLAVHIPGSAGQPAVHFRHGLIEGSMSAPAGENGFGWDPIFIPRVFTDTGINTSTFAQMLAEQKNWVSMRQAVVQELRRNPFAFEGSVSA